MLESPLLEALRLVRSARPVSRPLTEDEVSVLRQQGNVFCSGCTVEAAPGFDARTVHGNRFSGRVVLAGEAYHSVLEDSELEAGAIVDHCALVRRTLVGAGAVLRQSSLDCTGPTAYGVGTVIQAGLETSGREIRIWDSMTLDTGERFLSDPPLRREVDALAEAVVFDRTVVGAGVTVVNAPWIDRAFFGPGTRVVAAQRVDVCATLSTPEEPVVLGAGVHVCDCIVQWGAKIESAAQVSQSILLEYSGAQRQALVTGSLIGPNTVVGGGEVTACFLGPFVGFHHQSLLIATWWPEGRGNVGYGANVGSNHTSRAPDQELWAGEGTFFGLAASVKFPANFRDAPYSVLATGVVTLPQRLALPFSLITDERLDTPETKGLNRVIPGWVLNENVYLLLRNEAKYLQRNQARRHAFDLRIFRPENVEKLWKARELLAKIQGKPVYTRADLPAVGKNYLLEDDRLGALRVYQEFLEYAALKLFADSQLTGSACDPEWLKDVLERLNLDPTATERNLTLYLATEQRLWTASLEAKRRDDERGARIIPGYETFHELADSDAFLLKRKEELNTLAEKIRNRGSSVT